MADLVGLAALELVADPEDPRIALYRSVSDPELARSHGLFIAEGRLVVRRVLENPCYVLHSLLLNDAAYRNLAPALTGVPSSVPVWRCDTDDFVRITGFKIHRGCLALVERPAPMTVSDVAAHVNGGHLVVLDSVANADNIGGVFRNAAAFGAAGVVLSPGCCDPLYRKAVRTSMAAVLRVPFAQSVDWSADLAGIRQAGFAVVALTPRRSAESLDGFAARARGLRLALVLGAEGSGVTPLVESMADVCVRIPIHDDVDSLNVAVAAGIALYRLQGSAARMP